jgi:hypothetical protein
MPRSYFSQTVQQYQAYIWSGASKSQSNSETISLLKEESPKWVVRLDVRHFFESINRTLLMERFQEDGRLNYQAICLLKNLFAHPTINPEKRTSSWIKCQFCNVGTLYEVFRS